MALKKVKESHGGAKNDDRCLTRNEVKSGYKTNRMKSKRELKKEK